MFAILGILGIWTNGSLIETDGPAVAWNASRAVERDLRPSIVRPRKRLPGFLTGFSFSFFLNLANASDGRSRAVDAEIDRMQ